MAATIVIGVDLAARAQPPHEQRELGRSEPQASRSARRYVGCRGAGADGSSPGPPLEALLARALVLAPERRKHSRSRRVTQVSRCCHSLRRRAHRRPRSDEPLLLSRDRLLADTCPARGSRARSAPSVAPALARCSASGGLGGGTGPAGRPDDALGEERAHRVWAHRAASVIACPLRGVSGGRWACSWSPRSTPRPLGARRPADVEVVADLAAMALERRAPARDRGPPRPRRAAPEARGRGGVGVARARARSTPRGATSRQRHRRQRRSSPASTPGRRAARGGERGLLGRAGGGWPWTAAASARWHAPASPCCAATPRAAPIGSSCTRRSSWGRACTAC